MAGNGQVTDAELLKTSGAHIPPCVWMLVTELQDLVFGLLSFGFALVLPVLSTLPFLLFGIGISAMSYYMLYVYHFL